MTCQHCKSGSGTYDMNSLCCAARFIDKQITNVCRQYGHKRSALVSAMREQAQAKRTGEGETR